MEGFEPGFKDKTCTQPVKSPQNMFSYFGSIDRKMRAFDKV